MSPYLKSTFARLIAMINKTEQKFEDYRSFFLGQMTLGNAIQKRQALLLTGIAMSAAALYESFELDATITEVQNRQNMLVCHVDSLTDDMKTTVRNKCQTFIWSYCSDEGKLFKPICHYIARECSFGDDCGFAKKIHRINLLSHRLFMEIVDGQDMEVEFDGLQQALRQEGIETVFQSVAQIYQLPVAFFVDNSTVTAIVKIPVIPNGDAQNFHLF